MQFSLWLSVDFVLHREFHQFFRPFFASFFFPTIFNFSFVLCCSLVVCLFRSFCLFCFGFPSLFSFEMTLSSSSFSSSLQKALPKEILAVVFAFCSLNDLANFMLVDRLWCSAVKETWRRKESLTLTGKMLRKGMTLIVGELCGSSLKKLMLQGLGKQNEEIGSATACFSSLTSLEELHITGRTQHELNNKLATRLCDEQTQSLHPAFASALTHLVSLRSLSLCSCHLTATAMISLSSVLSDIVHLHSLTLSHNQQIGSNGIALLCSALSLLPDLQCLVLAHCHIEDSGFSSISSVLRFLSHLTNIDLSGNCTSLSPANHGFMLFVTELHCCCPLLHSLSVGHNCMTSATLSALLSALPFLPYLHILHIPNIHLDRRFSDFLAAVPFLVPTLTGINLSLNPLDRAQWSSFSVLLPQFTHLLQLDFSSMRLCSDSLFRDVIVPALSQIRSLSSLNLSNNWFGVGQHVNATTAHSDATALTQLLGSLPVLQELNLSFCNFDSDDLLIITESFSRLPPLHSIYLSGLFIRDNVVEPLIAALVKMNELRFLSISCRYVHGLSEVSKSRLRSALRSKFPQLQLIVSQEEADRLGLHLHSVAQIIPL